MLLTCKVGGERRGPIGRQLELVRRQGEVFDAVDGLKCVVRERETRNHYAHLARVNGQLRIRVQRDVLAARR
jgi:hypothetical protein